MTSPRVNCPGCGASVALYATVHGSGWNIISHIPGSSSGGPECPGSRTAVASSVVAAALRSRAVTVELDARDAELVGMSLQLLARDHKSPDLTVAARLQRVGDALRRAAKIEATVDALEQREVVS